MKGSAETLLEEIYGHKDVLRSFPTTINIELTGRCNVTPPCVFCVGKNEVNYREPGCISLEQLNWFLDYMTSCQRVNDCSYGEPFLYPRLEYLIDRLTSRGVEFGFTTNGLLLDERRSHFLLDHVDSVEFIVSVNAASSKTYYRLHGGDFNKLINNLELFITLHRHLRSQKALPLWLSYIVMRSNLDEVGAFLRMAIKWGVKRVMLRHLFEMHAENYTCMNFGSVFCYKEEMLPLSSYTKLEKDINSSAEFRSLEITYLWNEKESLLSQQSEKGVDIPCLFPWKFLCIRPLHDLYTPCPFLKKGIALPSTTTIKEVWNGDIMVDMRRSLSQKKIPEFCLTFGDICPLVMTQRELRSR